MDDEYFLSIGLEVVWYGAMVTIVKKNCSVTEKMGRPQWHIFMCTGKNMLTTSPMSFHKHICSTTFLKTSPVERKEGRMFCSTCFIGLTCRSTFQPRNSVFHQINTSHHTKGTVLAMLCSYCHMVQDSFLLCSTCPKVHASPSPVSFNPFLKKYSEATSETAPPCESLQWMKLFQNPNTFSIKISIQQKFDLQVGFLSKFFLYFMNGGMRWQFLYSKRVSQNAVSAVLFHTSARYHQPRKCSLAQN